MESIRQLIEQISQQLDVLSKSQKIAIALCAAIVAGSFIWLIQSSTAPELTPVLAQDMSLGEIDKSLEELKVSGITAKQVGRRVYVKPVDRDRALLTLNKAGALPQDTSVGFAELMADENPFRPNDENKWRRQVALGTELARIISTSDDVESARVITQEKKRRVVGSGVNVRPTASIYVKMAHGKSITRPMVDGLCRFVAGAVPGLNAHDVTLVDARTMRAFTIPDPEDVLGVEILDHRKKNEKHLTDKLMAALQSIPGAIVTVSVELDASKTKTQKQSWAKPEVKAEETSSTSNSTANTPGSTGVNPNIGVGLTSNTAGTSSETEESRTEFFDQKPTEVTNTEIAPFSVVRSTASIGIPRSFIVGIYQARFGADKEQSKIDEDADFAQIRESEIARVRSIGKNILMADSDEDVDVQVFYDFVPGGQELNTFPGGEGAIAGVAPEAGTMGYLRAYGLQGGLMLLAIISFMVMTKMVRKSTEVVKTILPPERVEGETEESEEALQVAGGPVGKAATTEGLLVGQEIDEDTLKFTQLGEQVSEMVEADPVVAADMIRRWVESDD